MNSENLSWRNKCLFKRWKISNLTVEFTGLHDFPLSNGSLKYIYMWILGLSQKIFSHTFLLVYGWIFSFFSPSSLSFVMQWITVGNKLDVLTSSVVFSCSFFLVLGRETCTKSKTWWRRETFLQCVIVETCQGNSVNLPIWAYLETIAFQILSQVALRHSGF